MVILLYDNENVEFKFSRLRRHLKHSTLVSDYSEGDHKDRVWIARLLNDHFHRWKIVPTILFTNFGSIKHVFHNNFKTSKQCRSNISRLSKFYHKLIQLWSEVR